MLLLFEAALGVLRQAGATLADDFALRQNRLGLAWDANRYGQGPATGAHACQASTQWWMGAEACKHTVQNE